MSENNKEKCECVKECVCDRICPVCGGAKKSITVCNMTFWDMWLQKLLRNLASMKFQWLLLLYIPTIWGMFHIIPGKAEAWISASLGLGFLGGGFVTLALGRIIARTRLTEPKNGELDTDK